MKTCANCESSIGNLEPTYDYQNQIVCGDCHTKLKAIQTTTTNKEPETDQQEFPLRGKRFVVHGKRYGSGTRIRRVVEAESKDEAKYLVSRQAVRVTSVEPLTGKDPGDADNLPSSGSKKWWATLVMAIVLGAGFYVAHQAGYDPKGWIKSLFTGGAFLPSLAEAERELRQSNKPFMQRVTVNLSWEEDYDGEHYVLADIKLIDGSSLPESSRSIFMTEVRSVVRSYAPEYSVKLKGATSAWY